MPTVQSDTDDDAPPSIAVRGRGSSREFEDVDLRRNNNYFGKMETRLPIPALETKAAPAGAATAPDSRSARARRLLSRTRSFAQQRRSKSGVIDENAVADPDVILMADAVLSNRPSLSRSPPSTPTDGPPREDVVSGVGSASKLPPVPEAAAAAADGSRRAAVSSFLRIGRSHTRGERASADDAVPMALVLTSPHDASMALTRGGSARGSRDSSVEGGRELSSAHCLSGVDSAAASDDDGWGSSGGGGGFGSSGGGSERPQPPGGFFWDGDSSRQEGEWRQESSESVGTAGSAATLSSAAAGCSSSSNTAGGGSSSDASAAALREAQGEAVALRRRVELLSAQLAASEAALKSAQEQSLHWKMCVQDLFNGLLLNPRMNAKYEMKVTRLLERAIMKLEQIEAVRYVKCSFPSVASEAPRLRLIRWVTLDESEWEVTFEPTSWKIELCLEGRQILPFKLLVRVGHLRIKGELRLSLPNDLMSVLLSFNSMPAFDMSIDSEVSLGSVPMPLQRGASALIRHELRKWLEKKAVAPHAMRIKRAPPQDANAHHHAHASSCGGGSSSSAAAQAVHGTASAPTASSGSGGDADFAAAAAAAATAAAMASASGSGAQAADEQPTYRTPSDAYWGSAEGGAPTFAAPTGGEQGGEEVEVPGGSPPMDRPSMSDEDLRSAILAALIKHDNPRVGVGRSRGRGFLGARKR